MGDDACLQTHRNSQTVVSLPDTNSAHVLLAHSGEELAFSHMCERSRITKYKERREHRMEGGSRKTAVHH